jgi:hypothetical protein
MNKIEAKNKIMKESEVAFSHNGTSITVIKLDNVLAIVDSIQDEQPTGS